MGLLIAVALEQSVEFVHRYRERAELREALVREAEKAREDTEVVHAFADSLPGAERYHFTMNDSVRAVIDFNQRFLRAGSSVPQFASADKDDLKEFLRLLIAARSQVLAYEHWCMNLHGAAIAIVQGERDLKKIQAAENRPW